jgi:hypothetical protein
LHVFYNSMLSLCAGRFFFIKQKNEWLYDNNRQDKLSSTFGEKTF